MSPCGMVSALFAKFDMVSDSDKEIPDKECDFSIF